MKRFVLLAVGLILLVVSPRICDAQEQDDGNWWMSLTQYPSDSLEGDVYRLTYVDGFFHGQGAEKAIFSNPIFIRFKIARYLSTEGDVTIRQVVDGLTGFYSDYRNRSIDVRYAEIIVEASIKGMPASSLDRMITELRKHPSF